MLRSSKVGKKNKKQKTLQQLHPKLKLSPSIPIKYFK